MILRGKNTKVLFVQSKIKKTNIEAVAVQDLGSCTTPLSENTLKNLGGDGGYEVVLGGGDGGVEDCGIVEKLLIRCLGVLTDKLTDRRTLLFIVESLSRPVVYLVPTKDDHQQKILFALLPLPWQFRFSLPPGRSH